MIAIKKQVHDVVLAVLIGVLAACSTTVERVTDPSKVQEFAFLQSGVTSNKEVEARLGRPLNVYEGGRIATYIFETVGGKYRPTADRSAPYHLVLVFRVDGVLERWSLVDTGM